jgi:hypothetical protein
MILEIIFTIIIVLETLYIIHLKLVTSRHDGEMHVEESEDGKIIFSLDLEGDPMHLLDVSSVSFKVVSQSESES